MRFKKEILKSPFFMLLIIVVIIVFGFIFVELLTTEQTNNEEIILEEKIQLVPHDNMDLKYLYGDEHLKYEDDEYSSMFGIDVAAHQDVIDWQKVKEAGVEFAYIRVGYRSAINGALMQDIKFYRNYKGALENGIKIGIYWYSQPINEREAKQEADYVLSIIENMKIDLPIAYDFEETTFADGRLSRMNGMSKEDRTKMAKTFCDEIKKHNYDAMIYSNLYWADAYYDWDVLSDYPIWFAQFAKYPRFEKPFAMWQYTENGRIDGIDHSVDFNLLFIRKNDQN